MDFPKSSIESLISLDKCHIALNSQDSLYENRDGEGGLSKLGYVKAHLHCLLAKLCSPIPRIYHFNPSQVEKHNCGKSNEAKPPSRISPLPLVYAS